MHGAHCCCSQELTDFADDRVANDSALSEEAGCSQQFRDDLQQFLHSKAKDLEAAPLEEGEPPRRLLEGLCQRQVTRIPKNSSSGNLGFVF